MNNCTSFLSLKLLPICFLSIPLSKKVILESVLLSVKPGCTWIVDSGATDHMTWESSMFSSYSPCASNLKIKIADDSLSAVAGKGAIIISPLLTLQDVLHVPNLSCNLLFVSKLTRDKRCQTHFLDTHCLFQD